MAGNTDRGFLGFGHKDEDKPQQHQQEGYGTGMQQQPMKHEGYAQGEGYAQQGHGQQGFAQQGHGTQMPVTGGTAGTHQTGSEEQKPGLKEKIGETLGISKLKKGQKKGEKDGSSSSSSDEEDNATGEKKKHHFLG